MAAKIAQRLEDLHSKARAAGQWQLAAAAHLAMSDETNLDLRINVVGAMHEVGLLRNRIAPFWEAWRTEANIWVKRCLERLQKSDHDYWAVAALLGLDIRQLNPVFLTAGYSLFSLWFAQRFDKPQVHVAVYAPANAAPMMGRTTLAPAFEIGWDSKSGEVVDSARWRAIIFEEGQKVGDSHTGKGFGSYCYRAVLPHGAWRGVDQSYELSAAVIIPITGTLLG